MTQRLRHHHHVAQLHAGNDKPGARRRRAGAQHRRGLGRAPVRFHPLLGCQWQAAKPGQVIAQRQHVGQALRGQAGQGFGLVKRAQRVLHQRRDLLGRGRAGGVTRALQRSQHVVQAFGHVQEGRAKVALTLRVVVDHHRHAALGGRRLLQPGQGGGFGGHRMDLRGQRIECAGLGVAGGDQQGIRHASQLAGGVVIGHVAQRQAVLAVRPLRRVHRQRGHGLQHRNADAFQLGLALGRVEDQRSVDEHVGQAIAIDVGCTEKQVFLLAWAIEGIGAQATLLQRGDQRVQPGRVV